MTLTAYAKRRGVSKMAVSAAVRDGRLRASVFRDEKGRPWVTDPDLADREWAGNSDYTDAPQRAPTAVAAPVVRPAPKAAQQGLSFGEAVAAVITPPRPSAPAAPAPASPSDPEADTVNGAAAREKHWKAKLAELEYRQEAGELVPARDVEREVEGRYTRVRTKLLGIPSRARQVLPELTLGGVAKLEQLVREVLEELSA